jgi:hypothetical protein
LLLLLVLLILLLVLLAKAAEPCSTRTKHGRVTSTAIDCWKRHLLSQGDKRTEAKSDGEEGREDRQRRKRDVRESHTWICYQHVNRSGSNDDDGGKR